MLGMKMTNTEKLIRRFPKGICLDISVVFPGEYRIGWHGNGYTEYPPEIQSELNDVGIE